MGPVSFSQGLSYDIDASRNSEERQPNITFLDAKHLDIRVSDVSENLDH